MGTAGDGPVPSGESMTTERFEGRLGIQQRVLPSYRVSFFDDLAARCSGGLSILAGRPRKGEGIDDGGAGLRRATLHRADNVHIGGSRQYLVHQRSAVHWFQGWRPDVLVMEASIRTVSNHALLKAAHESRRPVIGWGLGVMPWSESPRVDSVRRKLLRAAFTRFDAMIAYSSKARADYVDLGIPADRIRVAPNSAAELRVEQPKARRADAAVHDQALRREAGLGDKPIVVFLGRLLAGKGVDRLIRAMTDVHDEAELVIVGDGAERPALERLAADLHARATFLGERRGSDLDRVMSAADMFVLPGLGGLALQEAVCWGLPVVVAGGDGTERDLVKPDENGFLVQADDPSALARAIRRLAGAADLRERMGEASIKLIRGGLGLNAMLREFVGLLNDVHRSASSSISDQPRKLHRRRIVVVCKNPIEDLPPAITTVHCLAHTDANVRALASSIGRTNKDAFLGEGVQMGEIGSPGRPARAIPGRLAYWRRFQRAAWRAMASEGEDTLLWISSADTALALGSRLLKRRFVLQVNELYDTRPVFRRLLAPYVRGARAVVVPESNRASIFRHWYGLPSTPFVIPNKPLLHPRERKRPLDGLGLTPEAVEALRHRAVLYQGHVDVDRSLLAVAKAFRHLDSRYRFVLMGVDHGAVDQLRAVCPALTYIPPIPAPAHLLVTSHATLGIISYGFASMNDLFCAPNKIWEFAGFGIPVVAQRLPGLLPYVEGFRAGACVDFDRPEAIAAAIHAAAEAATDLEAGARQLYDSVDVRALIASVVEHVEAKR